MAQSLELSVAASTPSQTYDRTVDVLEPPNRVGRRRTITPHLLSALLERLIEKPGLHQDEMVISYFSTTSNVLPGDSFHYQQGFGVSRASILVGLQGYIPYREIVVLTCGSM